MLQGANGEQHLLKYGDAIPEIIYGAQEGAGFGANLQCSLQEDEKGNICSEHSLPPKTTVLLAPPPFQFVSLSSLSHNLLLFMV